MDPINILVRNIRTVQPGGNLKAFVEIAVDDGGAMGAVEIKSLRIIQQPNQRPFVQMPISEYFDKEGKRQFSPPIIKFAPTAKQQIEDAVLDAWVKQEGQA